MWKKSRLDNINKHKDTHKKPWLQYQQSDPSPGTFHWHQQPNLVKDIRALWEKLSLLRVSQALSSHPGSAPAATLPCHRVSTQPKTPGTRSLPASLANSSLSQPKRDSLWRKRSLNASHATRAVAPNISSLLPRRNTGKILTASLSPMGAAHMLIQWIIPSWEIKYLKRRKGTRSSDVHGFQASLWSSRAHCHLPSRINMQSMFKRNMNNCTTKSTGTSKLSKNSSEWSCWNAKISNYKQKSTMV